MNWIDLPSLQSITLGKFALQGESDNENCSLTMRSNNEMIKMIEFRSSNSVNGDGLKYPRIVKLESINQISNIDWF